VSLSTASLRASSERLLTPLYLPFVLLVFTASGFAGLIYESIWSHYLKLFLGHAAYAQTLVLAIFMGGMALGAWLASRFSARWRDPIRAYALVEATIGLTSLFFHELFLWATALAFDHVVPALGSPAAVHAFKWSLAGMLILPQSVLLGMTFPLMTGGILRMRPDRSGYVVAMLYFTNSLGAALGVIAAGFYLIGAAGLPGTMAAAAVVNLSVAAAALLLPRNGAALPPAAPAQRLPAAELAQYRLLLIVAALTGMSSFMYEIGWIRMLALVLGSSTHAFELMLSAFILGIAFGGLWIRRRIDSATDSIRLLGAVQIAMGICALATLPVYAASFGFMQSVVATLSATERGYAAFNLISHAICLAVMFPAAFCAGMTLPLATVSLLRKGAGERAVGQVYGANTLGAIAGVLFAVHVGLPLLGLKGLIVAGAAIDLALGVLILARFGGMAPRLHAGVAAGVALLALVAALAGVRLDAHDMASGVYRMGELLNKTRNEVLFQQDGKTATISVTSDGESVSLRTNGKSDGGVHIGGGEPYGDEMTMTLLGALPQFLAPEARRVANIGFGTGITAHVLLSSRRFEAVDTVEIEPAVVEASARHLRRFNARALEDPRSRVYFDDAKTFFSSRPGRYDVIISEPSNPWVSGVASLFTTEFYRDVRRYLRDDGLFLQWIQLYETSPALLATVVAALEENFADYELWMASQGDLVIVATNRKAVPRLDPSAFESPELRADLKRFRISGLDDLLLHRLGSKQALAPYFAALGAQANSDFYPTLDLNAARARFMRTDAYELPGLIQAGLPVLELFDPAAAAVQPSKLTPGERPWWQRAQWIRQADAVRQYLESGNAHHLAGLNPELGGELVLLRASVVRCEVGVPSETLTLQFASLAHGVSGHLPRSDRKAFWALLRGSACAERLGESVARWLRLHAAVADGGANEIAEAAKALLDQDSGLRGRLLAHAVAAYMAGKILSGDSGAAMRAYAKHRTNMGPAAREWLPVFRVLVGHAERGAPPRVAAPEARKPAG
jgi:spermidine synthase